MARLAGLIIALLLVSLPDHGAVAQGTTLLADNVAVQGSSRLTATGDVEVFAEGIHLRAASIIYDATDDSITIVGPIVLTQGNEITVFSDGGELSTDLQDGILHSARMVLDQQLQLAAAELHRVGGRYTQLYKTVASSCRVCNGQGPPLWQIRAESVVHDTQTRFLYFRNAQLRIGNVPVMFIPRLRLPDPTLKRATGFLQPFFRTTTQLGTGVKIPYFVALGDHADLTFTPYLSAKTRTLGLRYRQAFRRGQVEFDGAITSDDLRPGTTRAYLFGNGQFSLPRDFALSFDLETTSDPAYLLEYGYSEKDKLENQVSITRTRALDHFNAGVIHFRTLRGSELSIDDQLPNFQAEMSYERGFVPQVIGGQASWSLGVEAHSRQSSLDVLGRDVAHFGGRLDWSRSEVFGPGIVARLGVELVADAYLINQDSNFASALTIATPGAELEFRWPWVKTAPGGVSYIFEPTVYLAWSKNLGTPVPNDDSTIVEFDEGNLFAISRFPGQDRNESGNQTTIGAKWTRIDPAGWSLGIAVGRVLRPTDPGNFTAASGLDGEQSDWLAAAQLQIQPGFSLTTRALVASDFSLTKAEARLAWTLGDLQLASTYGWIIPDAQENRPDVVSQLTLDGQYRFQRHWLATTQYLYDFSADKATKATFGLNYTNECIRVGVSLSRRFTSSSSVTPTTDINVSVNLLGFGSGDAIARQSCTGL